MSIIDKSNDPNRTDSPSYGVPSQTFQARVDDWLHACFGPEIARDPIERNHRFLEESLELVQSCGCTRSEAHQLVDYVFGRDVGEMGQEIGGVMNTLAALCLAHGLDMATAGETELARVWTKVEKIRAKQAAKPKHSPLPEVTSDPEQPTATGIIAKTGETVRIFTETHDGWTPRQNDGQWEIVDQSGWVLATIHYDYRFTSNATNYHRAHMLAKAPEKDATIARLTAELEAAREALTPFAQYAEAAFPEDESYRPHNNALSHHRGRNDWLHVRVLDFRVAVRALAKLSAMKGV